MIPILPRLERSHALFLDLDGTLIDIAPLPEEVVVDSDIPRLLGDLDHLLGGAVAVVSGRVLADLDALLAPYRGAVAGVHGLELRAPDGTVTRAPPSPLLDSATPILQSLAASAPEIRLEDKGSTKVLHYRANPELGAFCQEVAASIVAASAPELAFLRGKMMVEIGPRGADKSKALLAYLAEPPFLGRSPVFVGDDRPDEGAFALVNRLGGLSIRVGANEPSAARYRLPDPASLVRWLTGFVARESAPTA